jgi:uncharacterized membrane protein
LLGWLAFPIAYRLLPALKDRGFSASRTLGLLIWGYAFWLLASLGVLPFTGGGLLFALLLLIGASWWALRGINLQELSDWLRTQRRLLLVTEILFLVAFAGYALIRAANPDAVGTEKPMELAFINAILHSPTFPPHDPWLSGYAISYYYFGYVMTAIMAKITGTSGGVAFNLGISLIFALSACGAYGLVANLLNAAFKRSKKGPTQNTPVLSFASLLGPLYVLIVSNLEGLLETLHARGIFWQRDASGTLTSSFWRWLDLQDLVLPPIEPFSWLPTRFWWWWRASRVLQDFDLQMGSREIIDEFPFFSFLLADLHPHVLAMPFAFLTLALSLNVFLGLKSKPSTWMNLRIPQKILVWAATLAVPAGLFGIISGGLQIKISLVALGFLLLTISGMVFLKLSHRIEGGNFGTLFSGQNDFLFSFPVEIDLPGFLLAAVALGGMAFLNTWDFPLYVFIFAAAYALTGLVYQGYSRSQTLTSFFSISLALGLCGGILYLPFYLGFSSQAGGILPNLIYPTRGAHFWTMFAPLLAPLLGYLLYLQAWNSDRRSLFKGFGLAIGIFLALAFLMLSVGVVILVIPGANDTYLSSLAAPNTQEAFRAAVTRRWLWPGTWLTLLIFLTLGLSQIVRLTRKSSEREKPESSNASLEETPAQKMDRELNKPALFAILLILAGLLLVLTPEFVYLYDFFGWRINTIFKFYFQAWLIWSIAAAFASVVLLVKLKGVWSLLFRLGLLLLVLASLIYPILSLWTKTNGFNPGKWTLDASAYFAGFYPDETAAIEWLSKAPFGVIAEAVPATGGSYTEYARVSTFSGQPAVLGWVGHENQWRGGNQILGSRQDDLALLYCSENWEEIRPILERYQIRYIFVSQLEMQTYQAGTDICPHGLVTTKFDLYLTPVFQAGQTTIYEYSNITNTGTPSN